MKKTTTQTFEYDTEDIIELIKKDFMLRQDQGIARADTIQVNINIQSEPGYDGPGVPPQVLTKITASYTA